MTTTQQGREVSTLELVRELLIAASPEHTFESIIEELNSGGEMPDGKPLQLKIEPWPGGRLFRDLGNNAGHLWAHVQVIKPPTLLELWGPMMMSYPSVNFVQYRVTPEGRKSRLKILHQAMGLIRDEHRTGMAEGWGDALSRIREVAEEKAR